MTNLRVLSKTTKNIRIVSVPAEIRTFTSGIHTTSDTVAAASSVVLILPE
jgi:hypothetical protein